MNCKTEIILPNNLPVAHTVAKPNRNEKIISDLCGCTNHICRGRCPHRPVCEELAFMLHKHIMYRTITGVSAVR